MDVCRLAAIEPGAAAGSTPTLGHLAIDPTPPPEPTLDLAAEASP
jgi:hypothetical protein